MPTATLTSKGQVTIPKQVRERLHLATGDQIEFIVRDEGTVLLKPLGRSVRDLFKLLPRRRRKAPSLQEIERSVLEGRAEDDERIRAGRE